MSDATIRPGARVRCRDVNGEWLDRVAVSDVQGVYDEETGRIIHDFAGVYIKRPDSEHDNGVFWPLEDVEVV